MVAAFEVELLKSSGVDAENPWPGLVAFTEQSHEFFRGRIEEAEDLSRRVQRKNLTVLFGQSGLGKSSLLNAGLFPRLRAEGYLPVSIRLDHSTSGMPLSQQVIASVIRAVVAAGGQSANKSEDATQTPWEFLHRRGARFQSAEGEPLRLVLVFDQFEELFSIGRASEQGRARTADFVVELADVIENRAPKSLEQRLEQNPELMRQFAFGEGDDRFLICLREDYLPHLEELRQAMPSIVENRMRLTRLDGARALEAVVEPARHLITPEVGRQVVGFLAGTRLREQRAANNEVDDAALARLEVEPSLLSLVCRELNNRRLQQGLPQITADLLAGSRDRILQDFYERCIGDQPAAVRALIEDELVTDSGFRESITLERARKTLLQAGASPSAIDELVRRRLLHLEERLEIRRVELTHDVLTPVVKKSRDKRQEIEALIRAEQQTQELRAKARRQRKRQQVIIAGMSAALLIVCGFGAVSYYQYRLSDARLKEAQRQKERAERGEQAAELARTDAVAAKTRAVESQKLADKSFDEARGIVDRVLVELGDEKLKDVPGLQEIRQRFSQEAADHYEVYAARHPDDPAIADGRARALTALGATTGDFKRVEQGVAILQRAITIAQELVDKHPSSLDYRYHLAQSRLRLGVLYNHLYQMENARPHFQRANKELEEITSQKRSKFDYSLALADSYCCLGSVSPSQSAKKAWYEKAEDLSQRLNDQHPTDSRCLEELSLATGNLANLAKNANEYQRSLALEDKFLAIVDVLLKRSPQSPWLLSNQGIGLADKAHVLVSLNRIDEATKCFQQSLESSRSAANANPLETRFQASLCDRLNDQAMHLSRLHRYSEAKALYEEACNILDALTNQSDDRPNFAAALIEHTLKLAEFYQGKTEEGSDEVSREQARLRYLDRAVDLARKFSKQFPLDTEVQFRSANAFLARAEVDRDDNKKAYPYYQACAETIRSGVGGPKHNPSDRQRGRSLIWLSIAQDCAVKLQRGGDVIQIADTAYQLGQHCEDREGIQSLSDTVKKSADMLNELGRYKEAVTAYERSLQFSKPALEKAPWHWYLRSSVAAQYRGMAESYEKLKDDRNEILAWREYLQVWCGPIQGMKIDKYLSPGRPMNSAEAADLRQFCKPASGMKRFAVAANLSGLRYNFFVYITNVPWPKDPLEDQARWLLVERGGIIPQDVRDAFRKLQKIAYENNVDFKELCVKTLGDGSVTEKRKPTLQQAKSRLVAVIVTKSELLNKNPKDLGLQLALATSYQELSDVHKDLDEFKESLQACEKACQLEEAARQQHPESTETVEALLKSYSKLGALYRNYRVRNNAESYAAYRRSLDILEQLIARGIGATDRRVEVADLLLSLGYLCKEAFTRSEAARWFLKAMELNCTDAARALASTYLEDPKIAALVPAEVRALLESVAKETKGDPRQCSTVFAEQFLRSGIARQWALANEVEATRHAAEVGDADSSLRLSEWYAKGTVVTQDKKKAEHYRYIASVVRGVSSFKQHRYLDAASAFQDACQLAEAGATDHGHLGMCLGKLRRWREAVAAYKRAIEMDPLDKSGNGTVYDCFEALIAAEQPDELLQLVQELKKKGFEPQDKPGSDKYHALYQAFQAMALCMSGRDPHAAEQAMREFTNKRDFKITGWTWDELDEWLKTTKLQPDRKKAIEDIIRSLKGSPALAGSAK
jgi:tetratricopeptide (TPR) repeat protein